MGERAASGFRDSLDRSAVSGLERIRTYYDETWSDYSLLWLSPSVPALHLGYWERNTRNLREALENTNRILADRAGIKPGTKILDAGCGVGGSAIWLARNRGAEVTGITIVPSQLDRAREYAELHGVSRSVSFSQRDYTATDFADAGFDVVWAIESVCHAADKCAFLREARRLLRPGGRLAVIDGFRMRRPYANRDEALLQSWLSGWAVPDLATGNEFVTWCTEAGFTDVRLDDIGAATEPSLWRLFWLSLAFYPVAALLHAIGLRTAAQHGNVRGARDQYRARRRKLWFEGMVTAVVPD